VHFVGSYYIDISQCTDPKNVEINSSVAYRHFRKPHKT